MSPLPELPEPYGSYSLTPPDDQPETDPPEPGEVAPYPARGDRTLRLMPGRPRVPDVCDRPRVAYGYLVRDARRDADRDPPPACTLNPPPEGRLRLRSSAVFCARGCTYRNRHGDDCVEKNCDGCLARRADSGRLCFPCHRRLETVLADMPAMTAWLGSHLATQSRRAARQDWERTGTSEHPPPPINLAVFDLLDLIDASLTGWVEALIDGTDLVGPDRRDIASTSGYLLTHLDRVECCDWVEVAWEKLTLLVHEAHALAPWRPELRRVEAIPCPDCHSCALVIFGGEEDVTCLECRTVIPKERYLIWTRIAADQWGAPA